MNNNMSIKKIKNKIQKALIKCNNKPKTKWKQKNNKTVKQKTNHFKI